MHVFVDTGIRATERGTDIINALQQVRSCVVFAQVCKLDQFINVHIQRFSPGNLHVAPCPVTRSLHLSRVNIMIGDGGVLEEIVEEELPLVIVIAAVLGSYRTVTHF
jgi:hypothetical protein